MKHKHCSMSLCNLCTYPIPTHIKDKTQNFLLAGMTLVDQNLYLKI